MSNPTILWYFADPMCSWCWGFTPVLDQIKETFGDGIKIALMMGGLRPGTTKPMTPQLRNDILHHWHQVNRLSGQKFTFEGAMPEGFIYDTEPACRAVITVSEINKEYTLAFFKKVQEAFYVQQKNVSEITVLKELVNTFPISTQYFLALFQSNEMKQKTQLHFQQTRQADVRGFPTVIITTGTDFRKITTGYLSFKDIKSEIDRWLQNHL